MADKKATEGINDAQEKVPLQIAEPKKMEQFQVENGDEAVP